MLDIDWQRRARERLSAASQRLARLLVPLGEVSRSALFCTVRTDRLAELSDHFARHAILVRRFDAHGLLRFGLPGPESEWQRLTDALSRLP